MSQEIKEFCQLDSCRRKYLEEHFGTSVEVGDRHAHNCCDNCTNLCNCDSCLIIAVDVHVEDHDNINTDKQLALYNTLAEHFSVVNARYWPSMIDPALMTGLTNVLAEDISNNYHITSGKVTSD